MSMLRLVVRDATRDLSGYCHGSDADRLVAALAAEPETIEELETALARFMHREHGLLARFDCHIDDEPYDAGVVVIDLAARLVAYKSTWSSLSHSGTVTYHDGKCTTDVEISFHVPEDWIFNREMNCWEFIAESRRAERLAQEPLDARQVLFGKPLIEFIARECFDAFAGLQPTTAAKQPSSNRKQQPGLNEVEDTADEIPVMYEPPRPLHEFELVREIHARWLMSPRDELRGRSPRDVLLEKMEFIDWDLQDRSEQWSQQQRAPRGLDRQSNAYRFAGFGRHEVIVYYDLVRFLLWDCRDELAELAVAGRTTAMLPGDFLTSEVPRLEQLREAWLDEPNPELSGHIPRSIIEHERIRLPEGSSPSEHVVDCDCPMCQMMADMPGPMFWGLDGCNMDEDFAFSFHRTRKAYDEEQRKDAERNRKWNEQSAEKKRLGVEHPGGGYSDPDYAWQRSFAMSDSPGLPLAIRLFSIGSNLAEIIVDLKIPCEERELIDRLSRDFGNMREVIQDSDQAASLLEPALDRFCETLDAVIAARADLAEKCDSLQHRLRRFLEPPSEPSDEEETEYPYSDDDIPF